MAVTWKVLNIEYETSHNGLSNVARNVFWYAYNTDSDGNYGSTHGNQQLNISGVSSANFTSFDSLTESQVIGWAKTAMGSERVTAIENHINERVALRNQTTRGAGVPSSWST